MKAQNKIKQDAFFRYNDDFKGIVNEVVVVQTHKQGMVAKTLFTEPIDTYYAENKNLSPLSRVEEYAAKMKWEEIRAAQDEHSLEQVQHSSAQVQHRLAQAQHSSAQVEHSSAQAQHSLAQEVDKNGNMFTRLATHARANLPTKQSLFIEMEQRWPIVEMLLDKKVYRNSELASFGNLVKQMESGAIQVCPMPIYRAIKEELEKQDSLQLVKRGNKHGNITDRRKLITSTLQQFIEYRKSYYPNQFWLAVHNGLDKVDRFLNFIISAV